MEAIVYIPALAVVLAASIPAMMNHRYLTQHVGKSNGNGSLNAMTEEMLLWAKEHSRSDIAYQEHTDAALEEIKQQINANTAEIISGSNDGPNGTESST